MPVCSASGDRVLDGLVDHGDGDDLALVRLNGPPGTDPRFTTHVCTIGASLGYRDCMSAGAMQRAYLRNAMTRTTFVFLQGFPSVSSAILG